MARRLARGFGVAVLALLAVACGVSSAARKIDHVVVLMLENRSFDHMLGYMKQQDPRVEGCLPDLGKQCTNPLDPLNATSPLIPINPNAIFEQVSDPNHGVPDTTLQVYGYGPDTVDPAPMTGFIKNYDHGEVIMASFPPEHVPAITALASEFALFDFWHSDVPGPTEVNRMYAMSGTSHGSGDNDDLLLALGYPQRTLFESIDNSSSGATWGIYFNDFPAAVFLSYPRNFLQRVKFLEEFYLDASNGSLPSFSWVEPRYFDLLTVEATDQHPDHDVAAGDQLINDVYTALRNSPKWNSTLLLVTYDEHGGFFDHVPPPINVPNPDGLNATDVSPPFNFTRLGVRVPTIAASPLIPKNTVVGKAPYNSYSHSSICATVREWFAPDQPFLTARDAWSAPFSSVVSLDEPRTDCPTSLPPSPAHRGRTPGLRTLDQLGSGSLSHLQQTFVKVASALNNDGAITNTAVGLTENDAGQYVIQQLQQWIGASH